MKLQNFITNYILFLPVLASLIVQAEPPFSGTIFIDPDIITSEDPSAFQSAVYSGQDSRTMFDRRSDGWITANAYLFQASFDDGLAAEIQVNPEFGSVDAASAEAQKYGMEIGRIPTVLRRKVETVWIHKGNNLFGGGNQNILIHTGQAATYEADGILEETLAHEGAHTSLDPIHAAASGWLEAQKADNEFISTYARDYPNREDIAESFVPYLAVRYRADRISRSLEETISQIIPNRISYFDNQSFDMYPITPPVSAPKEDLAQELPKSPDLQNYPGLNIHPEKISYQITKATRVVLTIITLHGQEIRTLVDIEKPAGIYQVQFDGRDRTGRYLSGGIYLYKLEAQGVILTKKIVLLP